MEHTIAELLAMCFCALIWIAIAVTYIAFKK